jgi:hypothetical protein
MDEQTQQRLETLLAMGIGFGLTRLVAERILTRSDKPLTERRIRQMLQGGELSINRIPGNPHTRSCMPRTCDGPDPALRRDCGFASGVW